MQKTNIDRAWSFKVVNGLTLGMNDAGIVDLPHDYSITQRMDKNTLATGSNAYLPGGVLEYQKKIFAPEEWRGKTVIVEFEGVYMNSIVRLNNNLAGRNPYGYTSFHCDLTPFLLYGRDNVISVTVNANALPNTRWYSGSGIYRHVNLLVGGDAFIRPWGVFVRASEVGRDGASLHITTNVTAAQGENKLILRQTALDAEGKSVATAADSLPQGMEREITAEQKIIIAEPSLWSPEKPYLYTLVTAVERDGMVIDQVKTRFGVRTTSFDTKNGFMLNGESVKMKGGCVHHDCGLLGAASYDRAEYRKIELLKASGFNAVRCAHNPPSPAFLDACDELGMLVIDEAFDCWNEPKMINDYSNFFADWWYRDLSSMVLRDRNHPSIILWSTGNEIIERDGRGSGYETARKLADAVRELDDSRAVTNALCGLWQGQFAVNEINPLVTAEDPDPWAVVTEKFAEPLDVVGYNYLPERYESDAERFPNRIICGTETFPNDALLYWDLVEKCPHVIGDFVWTSLDYLGEAGIGRVYARENEPFCGEYPWSHANCGDIDICGSKRPQSYYRDCVWGISEKPYIAVHHPRHEGKDQSITRWGWNEVFPCWTWSNCEGKTLRVDVYSAADQVELLLNGKSVGRKDAGKQNSYLAEFEVVYETGELVAVGYRGGKEESRTVIKTSGSPAALRVTADRESINAEPGDLCYLTVEALDRDGNVADCADNPVFLSASGAGSLIAVASGNPCSDEPYVGNTRKLYYGKMTAVVRSNGTAGGIAITAMADGLKAADITVNAKP